MTAPNQKNETKKNEKEKRKKKKERKNTKPTTTPQKKANHLLPLPPTHYSEVYLLTENCLSPFLLPSKSQVQIDQTIPKLPSTNVPR